MTRRRDIGIAVGIAGAAAVLLTVAIGLMVTLDMHRGEMADPRPRTPATVGTRPQTSAIAEPFVPADRVPVLCYHYVRGPGGPIQFVRVFGYVVLSLPLLDDSEIWKVSRHGFERQMQYLVAHGYHTVTLDDLHDWQMGRLELPAKSIVLTFDDGEESAYKYVYPVLEKYGLRATLFVVTSRVGTTWNGLRCLDWPRLREMQRSGVFDIESHTHDLHYKVGAKNDLKPVYLAAAEDPTARAVSTRWDAVLFDDLAKSRVTIERQIGRTPHFLAWPYGFGNPAVDQIAVEAGFTRTCALRARPNRPLGTARLALSDTEHFEIPRYTVTARTSLRTFREMLEGAYAPTR
jgi:peptidoglycan/xylan/chitin deacetylase (PgdA/CDA1 family)